MFKDSLQSLPKSMHNQHRNWLNNNFNSNQNNQQEINVELNQELVSYDFHQEYLKNQNINENCQKNKDDTDIENQNFYQNQILIQDQVNKNNQILVLNDQTENDNNDESLDQQVSIQQNEKQNKFKQYIKCNFASKVYLVLIILNITSLIFSLISMQSSSFANFQEKTNYYFLTFLIIINLSSGFVAIYNTPSYDYSANNATMIIFIVSYVFGMSFLSSISSKVVIFLLFSSFIQLRLYYYSKSSKINFNFEVGFFEILSVFICLFALLLIFNIQKEDLFIGSIISIVKCSSYHYLLYKEITEYQHYDLNQHFSMPVYLHGKFFSLLYLLIELVRLLECLCLC